MERSGYLEAAVQRFTEFGGFAAVQREAVPTLVAEWADLVLERVEPGLITWFVFLPVRCGSLLPAVRDELAEHLARLGETGRTEALGVMLLVSEEPITREIYDRVQPLTLQERRVRVVPWVADLGRGRLFPHSGPPFGIDPDLPMLAEPHPERPVERVEAVRRTGSAPTPWMTVGLAVVVVLVWLAMTVTGRKLDATEHVEMLNRWGAALRPDMITDREYWRLFTAGFLHIGIAHLFMNTLSLWWVGRLVERLYGRWRMLVIYLVALVAGSAASLVLGPPIILSAGASGAIFGLLGAALWYQLTGPNRDRLKRTPLLWVIGLNLVFGLVMYQTIDNWNHVGGLVGGFAAAAAVGYPGQAGRNPFRAVLHGLATLAVVGLAAGTVLGAFPLPGPAQRLAAAREALERGQWDEAEPGIREAAERQPDEPALQIWLAWTYYYQGRFDLAKERLDKFYELAPNDPAGQELQRRLHQR